MGVKNETVQTRDDLATLPHGSVVVLQGGKTTEINGVEYTNELAIQKLVDVWYPIGYPAPVPPEGFQEDSFPATLVWS